MSFMRVNKGKPKNPPRRKKPLKLKAWDDTVNDLDAYKATPDEIAHRKEAYRSKNAVTAHLLKGKLRQGKKNSPLKNNAQARKYAIMKEVLYDQRQLQDVLEKSDTMMAVVKDLFGDDPRRFAGFPTVTNAPNSMDDIEQSLVRLPGDIRTRSEVLSESVMDGSALNEFQDSDSEEDRSAIQLTYQPKLNMQRFQQFIEAEEKNNTLSTISGQAGLSHLGGNVSRQPLRGNAQSSQLPEQSRLSGLSSQGDRSFQTPKGNSHNESIEMLRPTSAINDTNKVNKTKRRVPRPEPPEQNTSNFSLMDLRKVLEILEDEVAEYERVTGRRPPAERQRQDTFSGYTLAIVDSVTKLTKYLKESELRLQAEVTVREQLTQDVVQFRALVDALTSDIILTQEEFGKLSTEFMKFRKSTEMEIAKLKGDQVPSTEPLNATGDTSVSMMTPPKSHQQPSNGLQNDTQVPPQFLFGEHLQPASSAIMLSPPVRRSRVTEPDKAAGAESNKQGSLMDFPEYLSSDNSAVQDEFTELPGLCATSNAHVFNQLSAAVQQTASNQSAKSVPTAANSGPQKVSQNNYNHNASVVVNSVSVPRPTPLVQSNVGIPLPSESTQPLNMNTQQMPLSFLEKNPPASFPLHREQPGQQPGPDSEGQMSHRSQGQMSQGQSSQRSQDSTDREFLASQIAALNRQHEEAQRRIQGIMLQKENSAQMAAQQMQQFQQQQQLSSGPEQPRDIGSQSQMAGHQMQQYQQQQNREAEQPRDNSSQAQMAQGLQKQQLQYMQQQRLIALVQQQQQKIQEQQRWHEQRNKQQQQSSQRPLPNIPVPNQQVVNGNHPEEVVNDLRRSMEIPGHRAQSKQVGLPDYPVSPNISPITRRSEQMTDVYKSVDSQDCSVSVPASRGIMVSLPKVDMDVSGSPCQ